MHKVIIIFLFTFCFCYANFSPEEIAKKYHINPEEKTSYQWIELFKDKSWLKKYNLDKLPKEELNELLDYLVENAADADRATLPGL